MCLYSIRPQRVRKVLLLLSPFFSLQSIVFVRVVSLSSSFFPPSVLTFGKKLFLSFYLSGVWWFCCWLASSSREETLIIKIDMSLASQHYSLYYFFFSLAFLLFFVDFQNWSYKLISSWIYMQPFLMEKLHINMHIKMSSSQILEYFHMYKLVLILILWRVCQCMYLALRYKPKII